MSYTKRAMEDVIDDVSQELGMSYDDLMDKVEFPETLTERERDAIKAHKNGCLIDVTPGLTYSQKAEAK